MMNRLDKQGGKKFGELKAKQESYIDALNRDILASEDLRYIHVPALSQKLDIYKKKFMEFDGDHSGDIDFFELKQMLEKLGQPRTHLEARKLLQDVDKHGRGAINYRDFVDMLLGNTLGAGVVFSEEEGIEDPQPVKQKKKRQAPKPPSQKKVTFQDTVQPTAELDEDVESDKEEGTIPPPLRLSLPPSGNPPPYEHGTAIHSPPVQSAPERRPIPVITTEVLPQKHEAPQPPTGGTVTEVVPPAQPRAQQQEPQPDSSTVEVRPGTSSNPSSHVPATQGHRHTSSRPVSGTQQAQNSSMPQNLLGSLTATPGLPPPSVSNHGPPHVTNPRAVQHTSAAGALPGPQVYPYQNIQPNGVLGATQLQTIQTYIPCNVPGCTQCPNVYPTQTYQMYSPSTITPVPAAMASYPAYVNPNFAQKTAAGFICQTPGCTCQQPVAMVTGHQGYQIVGQHAHGITEKVESMSLS